jgi:hypothetical protein
MYNREDCLYLDGKVLWHRSLERDHIAGTRNGTLDAGWQPVKEFCSPPSKPQIMEC